MRPVGKTSLMLFPLTKSIEKRLRSVCVRACVRACVCACARVPGTQDARSSLKPLLYSLTKNINFCLVSDNHSGLPLC